MFVIKLLLLCNLQTQSIRVVYSYNRLQYDSLEIIVNKNEKTIYQKNHTLLTNFDSTNVGCATKADTVEVILRGYKKNLYCYPHIERLRYPYYRMSYGLNFECIKLKT
jgi:hypothetical protein